MASVKVAVRVRPFNQREIDLESKLIISMEEKKTRISNSKIAGINVKDAGSKEFTFDHSYWSFDSDDSHFATQEQVFEDLGTEVVDSAFEGYNACVFAYGQTGSGKTFTMMGSPENQGLIPRICKSLFDRMHIRREEGASYRTEVSYLEIYNEKVKDLLQNSGSHSLRVREHPSRGPYVESLSTHLVSDYPDIQEWMKRGNTLRTTARTNMNDTSSRSHAIFTITFVQAEFSHNNPTETVSKIHLVDLAGSERADATGATGERLKEGAHINKSLVTLGLVISSLAKMNVNDVNVKRNSTFIPYRDSVLTWLLKDSLGGNSKTIMIAAISPADVNYEETLSTLRYANRAKNIINKPTVNEDPNVTLIRTLRDEINKLKAMMCGHVTHQVPEQSVLAQLQQKEAREKALTEEWTEKWRETKSILEEQSALGLRKSGVGIILDSDRPHLVGIDDDLLSTGVTFYHIKNGETLIGTEESDVKQDIELSGVGIIPEHCSLILKDGQAWLHPRPSAPCWVNNVPVIKPVRLSQGCIILLGRNNMFRFNHPAEAAALRKTGSKSQLNNSNLSIVYSSTTNLAERTFSHENLLESSSDHMKEIFHSSPKHRRSVSLSESDAGVFDSAQKIYNQELVDLEAGYKAEKDRLVADWRRLEEKHSQNVAHLTEKQLALREKKEALENAVQQESEKLDQITRELDHLKERKTEKQKEFEDSVSVQMDELRRRHEDVAATMTSHLSAATSLAQLVAVLGQTLDLLPDTAGRHKEELTRILREYNEEMQDADLELQSREKSLNDVQCLVTSLSSQLSALTSSSEGSDALSLFSSSSTNIKERKESLSLPLSEMFNGGDSGIGSGQTDKVLLDPLLSPLLSLPPMGAIKRRLRGSDSSEEEMTPGRPRSRMLRKQLSKSCRAIYDEVGIGEAVRSMNDLCQKVAAQKLLIMQSLEDDCSKEEINVQIADLQNLHRQYVRLEAIIELRKENVLLRMQQNRDIDLFSDLSSIASTPPRAATRSMPSLRHSGDDWPCWVRIPSFVLRGVGRQSRYEYEVRIRTEDEGWVLMRRYNRFRELHLSMCAKYGPVVQALDFPPKKWLPFSRESLARKRRCMLENYLLNLIDVCSRVRGSPLHECGEMPTRHALIQFSPFFRKGLFEPGKYDHRRRQNQNLSSKLSRGNQWHNYHLAKIDEISDEQY